MACFERTCGIVAGLAVAVAALAWGDDRERPGRIFVTATLTSEGGILAVDPETGEVEPILQQGGYAVRVAPDRRRLVFTTRNVVSVLDLRPEAEPSRLCEGDCAAVWSPDGKQLFIGVAKTTPRTGTEWQFETWRINADGSGKTVLPLPRTDFLEDWSRDGQWVVTTSMRNRPQEGRQVYRMRIDGTDPKRLTTGGDNLRARFSPDGRSIAYLHRELDVKGVSVWVMDAEGKERRKVYQIDGTHPEVCWSPDGKRLALSVYNLDPLGGISREAGGCRIELIDLQGENRVVLPLPQTTFVGSPDWR